MPKRLAFFTVSFLFLLSLIAPAHALFDNEVDKAKDFIRAGMFPQAIEQLNKRITDKPTDAEAHYLLGTCYMNTGNYSAAEDRFKSAVRLKADYGNQIGEEFKKSGSAALHKGQVQEAQELFAKAIQYQPSLKATISKELFSKGESAINQAKPADNFFNLAVQFDQGLKETACDIYYNKANSSSGEMRANYFLGAMRYSSKHNDEIKVALCDFYFEKGKSANGQDALKYFQEAKKYGNKHDKEVGQHLLATANKIDSQDERTSYLDSISKYVSEEEILKSSVDYYTKIRGNPKVIRLEDDSWIEIFQGKVGDTIHYLSRETFFFKSLRTKVLLKNPIKRSTWVQIDYDDTKDGKTPVWFGKDKKSTIVYFWIEGKK